MTNTFHFEGSQITYHTYGDGPKVMLAFHGFGQQGAVMSPLAPGLAEYTIYSFDLFYHGHSYWHSNGSPLTQTHWKKILEHFLLLKRIDVFSLLGFSLGGKFVLASLSAFPQKIEQVILIAPDGIDTHMWYNLATYPGFFRSYFRSMIVKPRRFFRLLNTLQKTRLVDKGISRFAASQMTSIKKRRRVYYAWVIFKNLNFDITAIATLLNTQAIDVTLFLGKYDKIITERRMLKLTTLLKNSQTIVLDSGHNNLIANVAAFLLQNH